MDNNTNHQDSIDYSRTLANLEEKLANIESERLALEAKEAVLRKSIASLRELIALESGEVVFAIPDDVIVPKRAFKGLVTIDAIVKFFGMAKSGQTARQIAEGLRQGGIDTKSKFFVSNVRTALNRQGLSRGIVRRGNRYWMAEWPNTPKEQESDKHDEMVDREEISAESVA